MMPSLSATVWCKHLQSLGRDKIDDAPTTPDGPLQEQVESTLLPALKPRFSCSHRSAGLLLRYLVFELIWKDGKRDESLGASWSCPD